MNKCKVNVKDKRITDEWTFQTKKKIEENVNSCRYSRRCNMNLHFTKAYIKPIILQTWNFLIQVYYIVVLLFNYSKKKNKHTEIAIILIF